MIISTRLPPSTSTKSSSLYGLSFFFFLFSFSAVHRVPGCCVLELLSGLVGLAHAGDHSYSESLSTMPRSCPGDSVFHVLPHMLLHSLSALLRGFPETCGDRWSDVPFRIKHSIVTNSPSVASYESLHCPLQSQASLARWRATLIHVKKQTFERQFNNT